MGCGTKVSLFYIMVNLSGGLVLMEGRLKELMPKLINTRLPAFHNVGTYSETGGGCGAVGGVLGWNVGRNSLWILITLALKKRK